MVIKREVAYGIVRGLSEFWKSEELQDFNVNVGSTQFKCHKFLLAACSGFFRGLFRSGMKETELNCTSIKEISNKTFELILETMYTGCGVLTNDNIIDIWRAANQLQILFLMEECEKFVIHSLSLDNYEDYFYYAQLLSCESVLETIWSFIMNHFELFSKTETFNELSEDKLLKLVKNQDLKVSNENLVIESILRWVDHEPIVQGNDQNLEIRELGRKTAENVFEMTSESMIPDEQFSKVSVTDQQADEIKIEESVEEDVNKKQSLYNMPMGDTKETNKKIEKYKEDITAVCKVASSRSAYLANLLSAARTYLASTSCLQQTMKHPKVESNGKAREIILNAVFYKMQPGQRNGQWLTPGIYRNCAEMENVALTCITDLAGRLSKIRVFSFSQNKWFNLRYTPTKDSGMNPKCLNICDAVNIFKQTKDKVFRQIFSNGLWETKEFSITFRERGDVPNVNNDDDDDDDDDVYEKMFLTVTENDIYIAAQEDGVLIQMDLTTNKIEKLSEPSLLPSDVHQNLPSNEIENVFERVTCLSTYSNKLLLFYSEHSLNDKEETAVQCYDAVKKTWARLNNLEGPATNLVSFRNDLDSFILQTSGDLWKVVQPQSNVVDFEYVDTLWGSGWSLNGAVTHLDDLYIFGIVSDSHRDDPYSKNSLPGIFNRIIYLESEPDSAEMVIKREIAYGIVRGISKFWKSKELRDFTVTVGSTRFECHSFILAACSGFFRGLFRSGMKETESKSVTIEDITSETFEKILETVYTGHGVLTSDNVIDIWKAADQLHITFLIEECENFVINSLSQENFAVYFYYGRLLNSKTVTDIIWPQILKHAVIFFKTDCFLELHFSDLSSLVKSQDLITKSEDDVIEAILKWTQFTPVEEPQKKTKLAGGKQLRKDKLESTSSKEREITNDDEESQDDNGITKHCSKARVNEADTQMNKKQGKNTQSGSRVGGVLRNERIKHLIPLLSSARTCLASHDCLEMSLNHPLIKDNSEARAIITKALLYQLQASKRNGQWPSGAVHRNKSDYENVAISTVRRGSDINIDAFSFSRNTWLQIPPFSCNSTLSLAAVGNQLFAVGIGINNIIVSSRMQPIIEQHLSNSSRRVGLDSQQRKVRHILSVYELGDDLWSKINIELNLGSNVFKTAVVDNCIYILSSAEQKVRRFDPISKEHKKISNLPSDQTICHVTCHEKLILVFFTVSSDGLEETAIDCFDTSLKNWTQLNNLEGPAKGMTSFKNDQSTYILQADGDLWRLIKPQSHVLDFEHVVKLWGCEWSLHGAVTFNDVLYIYGVKSDVRKDDPRMRRSVPGIFDQIIYMESSSEEESIFQPLIIDKTFLLEK